MKNLVSSLAMVLAFGNSIAAPLDLDLTSFADLASGAYDLDTQYNGVSSWGNGNVAGIYQFNSGQYNPDLVNIAEIQQVDGVNNLAMIWQGGFGNEAHIYQTGGENNIARLAQLGSAHYASLTQIGGSDNVMMVQMLGVGASITASQTDATNNTISVVLNSGSNLTVTQSGNGNMFSTVMAPRTSMTVNQTGQ